MTSVRWLGERVLAGRGRLAVPMLPGEADKSAPHRVVPSSPRRPGSATPQFLTACGSGVPSPYLAFQPRLRNQSEKDPLSLQERVREGGSLARWGARRGRLDGAAGVGVGGPSLTRWLLCPLRA